MVKTHGKFHQLPLDTPGEPGVQAGASEMHMAKRLCTSNDPLCRSKLRANGSEMRTPNPKPQRSTKVMLNLEASPTQNFKANTCLHLYIYVYTSLAPHLPHLSCLHVKIRICCKGYAFQPPQPRGTAAAAISKALISQDTWQRSASQECSMTLGTPSPLQVQHVVPRKYVCFSGKKKDKAKKVGFSQSIF